MPEPAHSSGIPGRLGWLARWGLAGLLVVVGCAGSGTDGPAQPAAGEPAASGLSVPGSEDVALEASRDLAIAAALHEGHKRGFDNVQVTSIRLEDGVWRVFIMNAPGRIGEHGLVVVSQDGEVLSYRGGR